MDLSIPPVKKSGSHGSHWECITGCDEDIQTFIVSTLSRLASSDPVGTEGIVLNVSQGNPIATSAIIADYILTTAYPTILEGILHEVMVCDIWEWRNELEGQITGSIGPAVLSFFDTSYVKNRLLYNHGHSFRFSLAAIAYTISRVVSYDLGTPDGRIVSTRGMAAFLPVADGDIDDYMFQTTVKSVDKVKFDDKILYRIVAPLFRYQTETAMIDIDIPIYISADILQGYFPVAGDNIKGSLWLQGYLA